MTNLRWSLQQAHLQRHAGVTPLPARSLPGTPPSMLCSAAQSPRQFGSGLQPAAGLDAETSPAGHRTAVGRILPRQITARAADASSTHCSESRHLRLLPPPRKSKNNPRGFTYLSAVVAVIGKGRHVRACRAARLLLVQACPRQLSGRLSMCVPLSVPEPLVPAEVTEPPHMHWTAAHPVPAATVSLPGL